MAMGSLNDTEEDFNPEINTTSLVDVMLVLLIIFIITIPVVTHSVNLNLPQASAQPVEPKPDAIALTIDADGIVRWNGEVVDSVEMQNRFDSAAAANPQPELHLHAERTTYYEKVAQVMAAAQNGGLEKIGFVTEPAKP